MSLLDSFLLDPHAFHVWIAYRTDGNKGSGTVNDPYNGSTQTGFDAAMAGLPDDQPLHIHLGPSSASAPFKTAGFYLNDDGTPGGSAWQAKPNMAIVGSGIDVTHLQLISDGAGSDTHYFAIGAPTTVCVDFLEISGLTIDCNLPPDRDIACGAIRVMGNHVRIRDVKCVHWGSRTSDQPGFVIALLVADPDADSPWLAVDAAGMENCIAIDPSENSTAGVMNILHFGGRELGAVVTGSFARGPFIRNCWVDAGSPALATEFRALSLGGCHGGIVEGNQIHNVEIGGPHQRHLNSREAIVRNNTYRNVLIGPCCDPAETGTGMERLLIDGNVLELTRDYASPVGILISGDTDPIPHGQVIIRNNRFRYVNSLSGAADGLAVQVQGIVAVTIAENLIEVIPAEGSPLQIEDCTNATLFNNHDPAGQPFDLETDRYQAQLALPAGDAVASACFAK